MVPRVDAVRADVGQAVMEVSEEGLWLLQFPNRFRIGGTAVDFCNRLKMGGRTQVGVIRQSIGAW